MAIKGRENKIVQAANYLDGRIGRTKVGNHYNFRTTFSSGYLLPLWCEEVYPGSNMSVDCGELVRSITPLGPTMDNSFLDIFFFFVPFRLVWDHWEEFIAGYNKEAWAQDVVYEVPQIVFDGLSGESDATHSWYDYCYGLGNPQDLNACAATAYALLDADEKAAAYDAINAVFGFSALYPRAYVKIWNDWFRDENLQDELELYTGDNDQDNTEFAFDLLSPSALPKVCKYHNRFTSCLPQPQKGPDVLIPMDGLKVNPDPADGNLLFHDADNDDDVVVSLDGQGFLIYQGDSQDPGSINGTNLLAKNVSNTIRMLRLATQTELLLARDARGGTRYVESLLSHFGVHNGDARLQRSEYLGSAQIPLTVMQVTNTAGTASSPLGNVGGQSVTKDNRHYFSKGFSEHGVVFAVATVRTNISYSHGIRKMYSRKSRFDFIWPEFRHIGDVPLYTKEISQSYDSYLNVNPSVISHHTMPADDVFGYTPYGSELRSGHNVNSGLFRDTASGSLSYLTYQEHYDFFQDRTHSLTKPILSAKYIEQSSDVVSNTLVDQSGPQFYALFDIYAEEVIPLDPTSDPGLMDHF